MPNHKESKLSAAAAEFLGVKSYAEILQNLQKQTTASKAAVDALASQATVTKSVAAVQAELARRLAVAESAIPEPEPAGVFPAPIVGYRAWRLPVSARPQLRSLFSTTEWPVREPLVASCPLDSANPHDAAPDWDCPCGIYAYVGASQLTQDYPVWGDVSLWGKVIRHKDGYRAQYAYPKRLHVSAAIIPWASLVAEALQRDYGVPCNVQVSWPKPVEASPPVLEIPVPRLVAGPGDNYTITTTFTTS